MKSIHSKSGMTIFLLTVSGCSGSSSGGESNPPNPNNPPITCNVGDQNCTTPELVSVTVIRSKGVNSTPDLKKMNCYQILNEIKSGRETFYGLTDDIKERMTFGNYFHENNSGWGGPDDKQLIFVSMLEAEGLERATLQVDKKILTEGWEKSYDFSSVKFSDVCDAPTRISYRSTLVKVSTPTDLLLWASKDAQENSREYANAEGRWKDLYGKNGLGYGFYAKGGWLFDNNLGVLGVTVNYDNIGLQWKVEPYVNEQQKAFIPKSLKADFDKSFVSDCSTISLRISSTDKFDAESLEITPRKGECNPAHPFVDDKVFSNKAADPIAFERYVGNSLKIAKTSRIAGENCIARETISETSCNQRILKNFSTKIRAFILGSEDLYVELRLSGFVRKVYKLNRASGEITEFDTRFGQAD